MDYARLIFDAEPDRARKLLREALDMALRGADPTLICTIRLALGGAMANNFEEAETYSETGLADAERQHDLYLIAQARLDQGYNRFSRSSRFDEAIPFLEKARDAAQTAGAKSIMVWATGDLGWCYLSLGDSDRAMDALSQAERLSAQIGLLDAQLRWLVDIGGGYLNQGDLARAADYQQRALTLAQELHNDTWTAIALNNLALVSLRKGDANAAQAFNEQALILKRRLNDPSSLAYSELNAAYIEARRGNSTRAETDYQTVIRPSSGQTPEVLWEAYGGLAFLYEQTHRPSLAEVQYRHAIETIDHEWNKLASDDWKTTFLAPSNLMAFFQDYVGFLIGKSQTERALEVAESSRARVLSLKLERLAKLPPALQVNKLVSAARASHTVVLSYWLAPGDSAVWVIAPGGLSYHPLPAADQIADLVRRYTDAITGGDDPLAALAQSTALYRAVLEPVRKLIPVGSNVIIVPDGALHQLNFETLVVPVPRPHYWIEDVTIATAPALRVLETAASKPRAPRLLLIGDPLLTGQEFPPLPNLKREIAAVEEHFPAAGRVVFTGPAAVPAGYAQSSPASFTHIHFATHAMANKESPLNSAIILSHQGDGFKLYARDVTPVPLTADLVTISACQSAGPRAYSGEGLMGFAWAFLYAGAHNVIATLWNEDDKASVDLMRRLYSGIEAGEPPAHALRAAKLALLDAGRPPYYWAPLEIFTRQIAR